MNTKKLLLEKIILLINGSVAKTEIDISNGLGEDAVHELVKNLEATEIKGAGRYAIYAYSVEGINFKVYTRGKFTNALEAQKENDLGSAASLRGIIKEYNPNFHKGGKLTDEELKAIELVKIPAEGKNTGFFVVREKDARLRPF